MFDFLPMSEEAYNEMIDDRFAEYIPDMLVGYREEVERMNAAEADYDAHRCWWHAEGCEGYDCHNPACVQMDIDNLIAYYWGDDPIRNELYADSFDPSSYMTPDQLILHNTAINGDDSIPF